MSHTKDKQDQVFNWFGTINHPKEKTATSGDFEAVIAKIIKSYSASFLFATILHDKDTITNENGEQEPKVLHLHLFLNTRDKAYTKEQILDHLAKHLELPRECIQIEPAISIEACIKYLTHKAKADQWKHQYSPDKIVSNHWEELEEYYLTDYECLKRADNIEQLINYRSLKFFKDYARVWEDIQKQKPLTQIEKEHAIYVRYFDYIRRWLNGDLCDQYSLEQILSQLEEDLWLLEHNRKPRFLEP